MADATWRAGRTSHSAIASMLSCAGRLHRPCDHLCGHEMPSIHACWQAQHVRRRHDQVSPDTNAGLLAPERFLKPYVRRGKNDAADAAAICEAVARPNMRFVPVKRADQQAVLMLHRTRALLVRADDAGQCLAGRVSKMGDRQQAGQGRGGGARQ